MGEDVKLAGMDPLGKALSDPKFRREFNEDPYGALERARIDRASVPEDFVSAMAELSTAELRLVVDIVNRIQEISPVDFPF